MKDREQEAQSLAFKLYGSGLTTSQVSRMFDEARQEVRRGLERPMGNYYPIVYIDAIFISTCREERISKKAYYTLLGIKPDKTREVLSIVNFPTESAPGWKEAIQELKQRGYNVL